MLSRRFSGYYVFSDPMKEQLEAHGFKNVTVIDHPVPDEIIAKKPSNMCFCPNGATLQEIELLENQHGSFEKIYIKGNKIDHQRCISYDFIDDYFEIISKSRLIFLKSEYSWRVSGIFYDCIACMDRVVVKNEGVFARWFSKKHGVRVI